VNEWVRLAENETIGEEIKGIRGQSTEMIMYIKMEIT
jgi:hypothetical protein